MPVLLRRLEPAHLNEAIHTAAYTTFVDRDEAGQRNYPNITEDGLRAYYGGIFPHILTHPRSLFLGAFHEGKIVGTGYTTPFLHWIKIGHREQELGTEVLPEIAKRLGHIRLDEVAYMGGLTVHPEHQGTGVGSSIVNQQEDFAAKNFKAAVFTVIEGSKAYHMAKHGAPGKSGWMLLENIPQTDQHVGKRQFWTIKIFQQENQ